MGSPKSGQTLALLFKVPQQGREGRILKRANWLLTFLLIAPGAGWAQTKDQGPPALGSTEEPLFRPNSEENALRDLGDTVPYSDTNSPSTDESSLKTPPAESRSYLQLGVHASESVESNPAGLAGYSSQYSPVTDVLGRARLRQSRRKSDTAIDYVGGGSLYGSYGNAKLYTQRIQQLGGYQSFNWGRGRVAFRDAFHYLSEGSYGSSSLSSTGLRLNPGTSSADPTSTNLPSPPVTVGQDAYLINVSGVDFSEALTPRSSVFTGGEYSVTNYFGSESLFNSRQASASVGYSYQLNRKEAIGAVYGYQHFLYLANNLGNIVTNSAQFTYRRTLTGRMDLALDGGPEVTTTSSEMLRHNQQAGATVSALLNYKWEKSSVHLSYNRQVATGSGFFAGVNEDIALVSFERSIHRYWRFGIDGGYTRGKQIGVAAPGQTLGTFAFEFAGGSVQRKISRYLSAFVSYQFDGENFSNCGLSAGCIPVIRRHIVSIGVDWLLRPIRLE